MSPKFWYFTVPLVSFAGWPVAAFAAPMPALESPTTGVSAMETIVLEAQSRPYHFDQVSRRVNHRIHHSQGTVDSVEVMALPGLDQLIDGLLNDSGQVTLPLGLRVYDTLGDPSVGFGADL